MRRGYGYFRAIWTPTVLGFYLLDAVIADKHLLAAGVLVNAVMEGVGGIAAMHAVAKLDKTWILQALPKFVMHALVKDVEGAFPETVVAEFLAIADDAAVYLVDLFETTILHQGRKNLATNAAGAIGNDWLILHPVILAGLDFLDEIMGSLNIWDDGVFELADLSFHGVAAIEEDDFVATLFDQLVDLLWLQVHAATDDAVLIHLQLTGCAECHDFVANLHGQAWEIIGTTLGPLEFHLFKARVLAGLTDIALTSIHVTTDGAVNSVLGDEDAAL